MYIYLCIWHNLVINIYIFSYNNRSYCFADMMFHGIKSLMFTKDNIIFIIKRQKNFNLVLGGIFVTSLEIAAMVRMNYVSYK